MMKKYNVCIEETIVQNYLIEAESIEDAVKLAIKKYKSHEIILEDSEVQHRQLAVGTEKDFLTEWIEF